MPTGRHGQEPSDSEAYEKHSEPILALEEPESHLHPSAIRALWPTPDTLAGQKIIATHSGDRLAVVPLKAIRRLARRKGTVEVFSVKDATPDARELQKVTYHVRAKRGALLFARCWLLVEGEMAWVAKRLGEMLSEERPHCVILARRKKLLEHAVVTLESKSIPAYIAIRKNEFQSAPYRWLHAQTVRRSPPSTSSPTRRRSGML